MNDLISRQAAIDALKNRWKKTRNYEGIVGRIIEIEPYYTFVQTDQGELVGTPHEIIPTGRRQ